MGPQTLLFTIQSLLRLGDVARSSYIDSVHDAAFTLPLLDFEINPGDNGISAFFLRYSPKKSDPTELTNLLEKLKNSQEEPSSEMKDKLREYYKQTDEYRENAKQKITEKDEFKQSELSSETLTNLFTIRQNSLSESNHLSVFKRMAGTFLEIGVDYFKDVPGSLNVNSREGMALHALFTAMDGIHFSTNEWKNDLQLLPKRFSISLLETISEKSNILTEDVNVQLLIKQTASGLTKDVSAYFTDSTSLEDKAIAVSLAETIFRSVVRHAGTTVANDPATFLGVDDVSEASFIKDMSSALFSMVLESPEGQISSAFNRGSLNQLVKTAIGTVSRHPELIAGNTSLNIQHLIGEVSKELVSPNIQLDKTLLPEIVRLVIEKSEANIELLWPKDKTSKKDHLLMTASKELLSQLARKPKPNEAWHLQLSRDDLKAVMDTALTEVAANPAWLMKKTGEDSPYLGAALKSMLTAINSIGADRINSQNGARIIKAGIRGAALRLEFFNKSQGDKRILERLFTVVLGKLLSDKPEDSAAAWQFAKGDMLAQVMEVSIEKLSKAEVSETSLTQIQTVFDDEIVKMQTGKAWDIDAFSMALQRALQITA